MTRRTSSRSRGVRPRHDPALVRRLLAERERTGDSFAELSRRSGIPTGTLAWWSHRERKRRHASAEFVEVLAAEEGGFEPASVVDGELPSFDIVLQAGDVSRRVTVPAGFDASELRRIIEVLEAAC